MSWRMNPLSSLSGVNQLWLYSATSILPLWWKHGYKVELVDRWFPSSKTCSDCGRVKAQLFLSERVFECSDCGFMVDRDLNAAINLSRYVPVASRKLKPVDELRADSLRDLYKEKKQEVNSNMSY